MKRNLPQTPSIPFHTDCNLEYGVSGNCVLPMVYDDLIDRLIWTDSTEMNAILIIALFKHAHLFFCVV